MTATGSVDVFKASRSVENMHCSTQVFFIIHFFLKFLWQQAFIQALAISTAIQSYGAILTERYHWILLRKYLAKKYFL